MVYALSIARPHQNVQAITLNLRRRGTIRDTSERCSSPSFLPGAPNLIEIGRITDHYFRRACAFASNLEDMRKKAVP